MDPSTCHSQTNRVADLLGLCPGQNAPADILFVSIFQTCSENILENYTESFNSSFGLATLDTRDLVSNNKDPLSMIATHELVTGTNERFETALKKHSLGTIKRCSIYDLHLKLLGHLEDPDNQKVFLFVWGRRTEEALCCLGMDKETLRDKGVSMIPVYAMAKKAVPYPISCSTGRRVIRKVFQDFGVEILNRAERSAGVLATAVLRIALLTVANSRDRSTCSELQLQLIARLQEIGLMPLPLPLPLLLPEKQADPEFKQLVASQPEMDDLDAPVDASKFTQHFSERQFWYIKKREKRERKRNTPEKQADRAFRVLLRQTAPSSSGAADERSEESLVPADLYGAGEDHDPSEDEEQDDIDYIATGQDSVPIPVKRPRTYSQDSLPSSSQAKRVKESQSHDGFGDVEMMDLDN